MFRKGLQFFIGLMLFSTAIANIGFGIGIPELKFFKEILLALLLIFGTRVLKLDFKSFGLAYVIWAILSYLWGNSGFAAYIFGLKYEIGFVLVYLLAQSFKLSQRQIKRVNLTFLNVFLVSSVAYLIFYLFGLENLSMIGYRPDWSTFIEGSATAFCQKIENSEICRAQGFLSGPNVFAFMSVFALAVAKSINFKRMRLLTAIMLLNVLLSFSRSGVIALSVFYAFEKYGTDLFNKEFYKERLGYLIGIGVVAGFALVFKRAESNMEHLNALIQGIKGFFDSPIIGQGINFSGPASRFGSEVFIPESWFMQIANNLGLVGLILFLGFIKKMYLQSENHFKYYIWAMFVPMNVLHPLEDSGFVYLVAILIAINSVENWQTS